jgi:hypothetical protein
MRCTDALVNLILTATAAIATAATGTATYQQQINYLVLKMLDTTITRHHVSVDRK